MQESVWRSVCARTHEHNDLTRAHVLVRVCGQAFVSDEEGDDNTSAAQSLRDVPENRKNKIMAFDDEQRSIRQGLLTALHGGDGDGDGDGEGNRISSLKPSGSEPMHPS